VELIFIPHTYRESVKMFFNTQGKTEYNDEADNAKETYAW
jgi:hypothetical protein